MNPDSEKLRNRARYALRRYFEKRRSPRLMLSLVILLTGLTGLLYRRLRMAAMEHWLGTAIRRTWLHVLGAALLLSIVGACLDVMAPRSDSLGKAVKEMFQDSRPKN